MFFDARDWQPVSGYRDSFQRVGFSVAAFFGAEKVTWCIFRRRKNLPGNFLERWKSYHFVCNVDQNSTWNVCEKRELPWLARAVSGTRCLLANKRYLICDVFVARICLGEIGFLPTFLDFIKYLDYLENIYRIICWSFSTQNNILKALN